MYDGTMYLYLIPILRKISRTVRFLPLRIRIARQKTPGRNFVKKKHFFRPGTWVSIFCTIKIALLSQRFPLGSYRTVSLSPQLLYERKIYISFLPPSEDSRISLIPPFEHTARDERREMKQKIWFLPTRIYGDEATFDYCQGRPNVFSSP